MKRIVLKRGTSLFGVHPKVLKAIYEARNIIWELAGQRLVITSGWDGNHGPKSLHYSGMAVDLRTKHLSTIELKRKFTRRLAEALGDEYDVLLEDLNGPNEHIHLEWDKGKYEREKWVKGVFDV